MTEHNMDVMELVENEPNARPFQCGWHTCTKSFNRKSDLQRHYRIHTNERPYSCMTSGCGKSFIQRSALTVHIRTHTGEKPHQCQHMTCGKRFSDSSSLARHRRIHTGKRPYKCAHEGCSKSFCRKTTMVKHQRRSHQPGIHSSELEDEDSSDSDDGESPPTPRPSSQIQWPTNMVTSSRSVMPPRHIVHRAHSFGDFGQQQLDEFSLPQAYNHRHSVSGGASTYNPSIPEHGHQNTLIMARAPSLPPHSSYYVPEQNNPGVATLNTSLPRLQTYHLPRHQRSQEMLQSSPSSYSPGSRASPIVEEEAYYPHRPAQVATYALHSSPIEDQQSTVQFQQLAHHLTQQQYHSTSPQDGQWYDGVAYQAPIEAISQIQAYQQAHISPNIWMQKIDTFDDISLQMPSVRVENL